MEFEKTYNDSLIFIPEDPHMVKTENFEKVEITTQDQLRKWLVAHHTQEEGVWLVTYKKSALGKYVSTSEVLDELLCFGWIDGVRRKLDGDRTMQLITPRRAQHWSKTYKERAAKLMEEGKMQEAGLQSIATSKASGLWTFMDDVDNLVIPDDLAEAFSKYEGARVFFDTINDSSKRFVLRWIKLAKTDKTRKTRLEKIALLSSKGEKLKGS
ncbi:MAG: YdeI/OmpD-associated family protein [Bacteroidota bacterium]